jgi:hypothetical protein
LVKNLKVLAFGIIENGRSWLFSTKMGVVWPLIIDQRLVHLTPHMFPCHRTHSGFYVEAISSMIPKANTYGFLTKKWHPPKIQECDLWQGNLCGVWCTSLCSMVNGYTTPFLSKIASTTIFNNTEGKHLRIFDQ